MRRIWRVEMHGEWKGYRSVRATFIVLLHQQLSLLSPLYADSRSSSQSIPHWIELKSSDSSKSATVSHWKHSLRNKGFLENPKRFFTQHIFRTHKDFLENPERFSQLWFSRKPFGKGFSLQTPFWFLQKTLRVLVIHAQWKTFMGFLGNVFGF
jgi:hypothetical protein